MSYTEQAAFPFRVGDYTGDPEPGTLRDYSSGMRYPSVDLAKCTSTEHRQSSDPLRRSGKYHLRLNHLERHEVRSPS